MQPVGRLAPSPTGLLHIGHARTFLLAWCSIRSRGGRILLRMEDLDTSRVRPQYVEEIYRDLEWLGLDWDGPVEFQSAHAERFIASAAELLRSGQAYPCVCTHKEIELARSAPHPGEQGPAYPGTCRGRFATLAQAREASGRRPALRIRVRDACPTITDLCRGPLTDRLADSIGDFPITSRDGQVAYQLAVVLDDARQGITEVLRGDDLLSSTPRQAYLQELLGLPRPAWAHVSLVLDDEHQRLAKRHDSLSLRTLREAGVGPRRLVSWLADSAGHPGGPERHPRDLIADFQLQRIPATPVQFGVKILHSLKVEN